jgi:hypothetical protein
MPNTSTPPPPKTGSGQFIAAVIVMVLLMGGLVFWKMSGSSGDQAETPAPLVSVEQTPTVDQVVPPPPPPPPVASAEDAGTPTAKKVTGSGIGTGCSTCGKCTGEPAPSFTATLRARAGQAQRCYEKALSQSEGLSGRLSVNLCVGVGGAVCGASVSNDTLGNPGVAQCVMNIYRATTFPSPKNGCVFVPEKK